MSWWKWKPTTTAVNQYSYKAHATALTVDLMTLTVNPRKELLSWWQAKTQGQCLKIQLVQKRVESWNSRTDTTDCITFAAYAVDINFGDDCCKEYKKVCVQLPTYTDNVALPAFARYTPCCCAQYTADSLRGVGVGQDSRFCSCWGVGNDAGITFCGITLKLHTFTFCFNNFC